MKVTHTGAPAYKGGRSQAPSNLRHVPLSSGYSSKYSSIVSDPGCRGTPGSAMSCSGATSSTVGGPGFSTYGALGASSTVRTSPPRGVLLTTTRLRSQPYPPRGMKIPATPVSMITQPTTCRSRNRRWAVTAKAKIAPMATNVKPVAVFMPTPSSSTHVMRFSRLPSLSLPRPERDRGRNTWQRRPTLRAGLPGISHQVWPVMPGSRKSRLARRLLAGLRRRARGLRIHAEVVQRARDDRQGDGARFDAAVDGSVVVMALAAGDGANGQPNNEQHCCEAHYYLRMSIPALITNFVTIATLFKQVLIFLSLRQPDWPSPATGASPGRQETRRDLAHRADLLAHRGTARAPCAWPHSGHTGVRRPHCQTCTARMGHACRGTSSACPGGSATGKEPRPCQEHRSRTRRRTRSCVNRAQVRRSRHGSRTRRPAPRVTQSPQREVRARPTPTGANRICSAGPGRSASRAVPR